MTSSLHTCNIGRKRIILFKGDSKQCICCIILHVKVKQKYIWSERNLILKKDFNSNSFCSLEIDFRYNKNYVKERW